MNVTATCPECGHDVPATVTVDDRSPATGCGCCDDPSDELGFKGGMCGRCGHPFGDHEYDPSPRSWSLPAQPPDDVTVVHVGGVRFDRDLDMWRDSVNGEALRWGELLDTGTVVEGEPPAPQPQEPPRFERGFYRLARDLDTEHGVIRERLVFAAYLDTVDEVWRVFCESGDAWVSAAALAAAGAERVEEGQV